MHEWVTVKAKQEKGSVRKGEWITHTAPFSSTSAENLNHNPTKKQQQKNTDLNVEETPSPARNNQTHQKPHRRDSLKKKTNNGVLLVSRPSTSPSANPFHNLNKQNKKRAILQPPCQSSAPSLPLPAAKSFFKSTQVVTMSSSPPQGNASLSSPSSASSERPQIFIEGQHALYQLEHTASLGRMSSKPGGVPTITRGLVAIELEPAKLLSPLGHRTTKKVAADVDHGQGDTSDARSVSSRRSSKFGIRKRLSRLFKGDKKVIETASASQTSSTSPIVSTVPLQPSPAASGTIRLDIFLENVAEPTYKTDLPKQLTRVDKTLQLVYCCSLISKAQEPLPSTSDSDVSQDSPLDDREKEWVQLVDPVLQDRYRWLVEQLVKSFAENPLKASD
ncbi:hypothetical protein BKA57DRAFT_492306, partial [Linnemannia elongata]